MNKTYLFIYLCLYTFIRVFIYLFLYLFIYKFICAFIYLHSYLSFLCSSYRLWNADVFNKKQTLWMCQTETNLQSLADASRGPELVKIWVWNSNNSLEFHSFIPQFHSQRLNPPRKLLPLRISQQVSVGL